MLEGFGSAKIFGVVEYTVMAFSPTFLAYETIYFEGNCRF